MRISFRKAADDPDVQAVLPGLGLLTRVGMEQSGLAHLQHRLFGQTAAGVSDCADVAFNAVVAGKKIEVLD
jgi:hypothetical protein